MTKFCRDRIIQSIGDIKTSQNRLFVPVFEDFIVESNQEFFCSETDKNNKMVKTH